MFTLTHIISHIFSASLKYLWKPHDVTLIGLPGGTSNLAHNLLSTLFANVTSSPLLACLHMDLTPQRMCENPIALFFLVFFMTKVYYKTFSSCKPCSVYTCEILLLVFYETQPCHLVQYFAHHEVELICFVTLIRL